MILLSLLLALPSAQTTIGSDDFNRPDAFDLGSNWTVATGPIAIQGNRAHLPGIGSGTCTLNNVQNSHLESSVSVLADSDGQFFSSVGVLTGFAASRDAINVKMVDNDIDGLFDSVWFTRGTSGLSWGSTQYVYDLQMPTQTCKLTVTMDPTGDLAIATIENYASGATEVYSADNVSLIAAGLGTEFGLAVSGRAFADDFEVQDLSGSPLQLSATGTPGTAMTFEASGATASASVAFLWSFSIGNFSIPPARPCGGTVLGLGVPEGWVQILADASGLATATRFVPANAAGLVHVQVIDVTTCGLSNVLSL